MRVVERGFQVGVEFNRLFLNPFPLFLESFDFARCGTPELYAGESEPVRGSAERPEFEVLFLAFPWS